jgi:hypothetical protein
MTSNQPRSDGSNATNKNRALALDTRFLVASGESSAATSTGQSAAAAAATMTHYYSDFLRTLAARGACPGLVAVTTAVSKSTKPDVSVLAAAGIVTKAHVLCTSKNALQRVLTSQTVIEPIIVQPLDSNASGAVSIPAVMSAESSWSLFGSMGT